MKHSFWDVFFFKHLMLRHLFSFNAFGINFSNSQPNFNQIYHILYFLDHWKVLFANYLNGFFRLQISHPLVTEFLLQFMCLALFWVQWWKTQSSLNRWKIYFIWGKQVRNTWINQFVRQTQIMINVCRRIMAIQRLIRGRWDHCF